MDWPTARVWWDAFSWIQWVLALVVRYQPWKDSRTTTPTDLEVRIYICPGGCGRSTAKSVFLVAITLRSGEAMECPASVHFTGKRGNSATAKVSRKEFGESTARPWVSRDVVR